MGDFGKFLGAGWNSAEDRAELIDNMVGVAVAEGSKLDPSTLPKAKITAKLILLTVLAVVGGFLFGYDTGVISGAQLYLTVQFNLNTITEELVVSVTVGAAAIFSLVGGGVNHFLGRKWTIVLSSLLFVIGSIVLAAATAYGVLIAGRVIVGIAIGVSSTTIPLYIAECSPPQVRGIMITMFQLLITFGLFMASVVGAAFSYIQDDNVNWRLMFAFAAVPALVQMIGFIFMPESPRWLVQHGKNEQALQVLTSINGGGEEAQRLAMIELEEIKETHEETEKARAAAGGQNLLVAMMQSRTIRKALIIGCILQMFQQLCGINTVMYYSATIIQMGGISSKTMAIWMASVTSGVNFVCTFIGVYLVDKIGRRLLLLGSIFGVVVMLILLGVGFLVIATNSPSADYVEHNVWGYNDSCASIHSCDKCSYNQNCGFCYDKNNESTTGSCVHIYDTTRADVKLEVAASQWADYGRCYGTSLPEDTKSGLNDTNAAWDFGFCPTKYSWLPILGMVLYLCSFSAGFGPTPWIICAEIFPTWARSTGTAITTASNWLFNLVISLTFLTLAEALTRQGAYFLYAGITFLGFIFCFLVIPETKHKKIEEIDAVLRGPFFSCGKEPPVEPSPTPVPFYNTMPIKGGLGNGGYKKTEANY